LTVVVLITNKLMISLQLKQPVGFEKYSEAMVGSVCNVERR
jgi:hypothetical protein